MKLGRGSRFAVLALFFVAATLAAPSAQSYPSGISGVAGCNCHGDGIPSQSVVASIEGLPNSYNYSESYEITVSFEGGPAQEGNINQGGFLLWASHGDLTADDATIQVFNQNEVGHTEAGNDQTSWVLTWTAPATDNNVQFVLNVNSVNGNTMELEVGAQGICGTRMSSLSEGP